MFVAVAASATAVNLQIQSLEINNHELQVANDHTVNYKYERGQKLNIDVCVQALTDVQDVQVEADITGYRYANRDTDHPVSDSTDTFDLSSNDSQCQTLKLVVPDRVDVDYYKLRVTASDRDGVAVTQDYELHLSGVARSDAVQIQDYTFNPQEIIAGRAFTAQVKVRNFDTSDFSDLKVTLSIPELNIQVSQYMDNLDSDTSKTFEELLLRIPECAKPGDYDVEIKVDFDEYEETTKTATIKVLTGDTCATNPTTTPTQPPVDKTVITVPNSQELSQGTGVVYPIVIANSGADAKTYTLSVSGASSWSTTRIDPSSVIVVPQGQSKTVYLYVSVNPDAELGDKVMTLTVDSGTETKQISLVSRVTKAAASTTSGTSLRNVLEIGLVVLVIILLIIGLIIGFNKMRENKEEPEPYY